jgi:hypothetical protein
MAQETWTEEVNFEYLVYRAKEGVGRGTPITFVHFRIMPTISNDSQLHILLKLTILNKTFKPIIMITNLRTAKTTCLDRAQGFMDAATHAMTSPMMVRRGSCAVWRPAYRQAGRKAMVTLRLFSRKFEFVPAATSWYLADLGGSMESRNCSHDNPRSVSRLCGSTPSLKAPCRQPNRGCGGRAITNRHHRLWPTSSAGP